MAWAEKRHGDKVAMRDFKRAVEIYDRLSNRAPLLSDSLLNFARSSYWVGRFETDSGNRSKGCRDLQRALALAEEYKIKESSKVGAELVEEDRLAMRSCSL